jgi:chromosome partition protein MukB
MTRARATALALVNWKGVFYERYQLDRRVTALEGANGAGKTTVMIAAYIVLLPDMTRLRFTNLGETAAIGGDRGIWGRLGEPTRPSYAALELDLGEGVRVVAGVLLTRKAEPTLELTPFLVSDLQPGVRLQDLLLVLTDREEAVPELVELRSNVAKAGAKLEVFASAKDYFAALFELGVGALRLASDEDRGRLGDMLRTSMTGGISRAITAELRSFLLREQGSLGDTLGRMRENLNACRRTRLEVSEAQLLEQEISGVYEAGQGMFGSALQSARQRAQELRDGARELEAQVARARFALEQGMRGADELAAQEAQAVEKVAGQRDALDAFRESRRLAGALQALRQTQAELQAEHATLLERVNAARQGQTQAAAERELHKQRRQQAQRDQERAALGLADLQAGLDELHRRSSAHRRAQRLLSEVADLGVTTTQPEELMQAGRDAASRVAELDRQRLEGERKLALAEQHGREWQQALTSLTSLAPERASNADNAFELARELLRELDVLEAQLAGKGSLEKQLAEQRRLAERQRSAEKAALALGLQPSSGDALAHLERELAKADQSAQELEAQKQELEAQRGRVRLERGALQEQIARAQASLGKHRRLLQRVERITAVAGGFAPTREAALRLRDSLSSEKQELAARLEQQNALREQWLRDANQLETSGGQFPSELLRLRDELDGELLGNRFEELDLAQAAKLEALLGPLTHAIVVDDLQAASERLRDKPRELAELRLIEAGTELGLSDPGASEQAGDVLVKEGPALRVTRRPERPSLGRRAREARIEELRRQAAALGGELEKSQTRLRSVQTAIAELDQLLPDAELLEQGDPAEKQQRLQEQASALSDEEQTLERASNEVGAGLTETRQLAARFRSLLSEAFLLDAESHTAAAERLAEQLRDLERGDARLRAAARERRELERLHEALRVPPPSGDELEHLAAQRAELSAQRDNSFRLQEALRELETELPALSWGDAEQALNNRERVAPALEQQHQLARAAVEQAELDVTAAEERWEGATSVLQREEAELAASSAHAERLERELISLGATDELGPEAASLRLAELTGAAERAALEERDLVGRRGAQAERVRQLGLELGEATRALDEARLAAEPAAKRWQELRARAESAHVLQAAESSERDEPPSALTLAAEARGRAELLCDRLAGSRGGEPLARELGALAFDDEAVFLDAWLRVREWLARRVPAQVAQVEDPLLALERLRSHLSALEQRLLHQEGDLRGASEDVARGIEVQLRRAKAQVRRLNQNLDGVSFGSIAGIRVELRRNQQMEPVLRALGEGSAQELLFQSNLPLEDALSEILKRYGGGRSGGARVLDYREYLELLVEVQRKADGSWEAANPTRLSTGEAIGVGAALMMVVLAEWERDANLLRARRGPGSLRFLFLDEANRLSQDNLGSLFDLCESLDLQLLIAAPEVARAEGNTTYRLVRKVTEDGREEVIVSGRRALTPEPLSAAAAAPPVPQQGSLFEN